MGVILAILGFVFVASVLWELAAYLGMNPHYFDRVACFRASGAEVSCSVDDVSELARADHGWAHCQWLAGRRELLVRRYHSAGHGVPALLRAVHANGRLKIRWGVVPTLGWNPFLVAWLLVALHGAATSRDPEVGLLIVGFSLMAGAATFGLFALASRRAAMRLVLALEREIQLLRVGRLGA